MNENAFTAISFPFLPPHPAAYVRTHVACQVQPHMNFYKLAQRKKKSNFLSCVLSHSTQLFFFFFHFAATCSVNQGCQAEMAGAQAGLHWFSQRMRGLSAAAKRASEGSVVFSHHGRGTAASCTFDCPAAAISLVGPNKQRSEECFTLKCVYLRGTFFSGRYGSE